MPRGSDWVDVMFRKAAQLLAVIGGVGILAMVLLTAVGVFWRYVLNDAIFGISDISVLTASIVVACSIGYGAVHGAHVSITLIEKHVGSKALRITDMIIHLLSSMTLLAATYALFKKSKCGFACGDITDNLAIVHSPFYWALGFSMAFCALYYLVCFFRAVARSEQIAEQA